MLLPLEQFKNLSSHLINHSILREDTQNLTTEISVPSSLSWSAHILLILLLLGRQICPLCTSHLSFLILNNRC